MKLNVFFCHYMHTQKNFHERSTIVVYINILGYILRMFVAYIKITPYKTGCVFCHYMKKKIVNIVQLWNI